MKFLKEGIAGLLISLSEFAVGILLLIDPVGFTSGIIAVFGLVLMALGIISSIKYFFTEPNAAVKSQLLSKGLLALLVGGFCAFRTDWFLVTFPVLTLVYGIVILLMGLTKIQWTADSIRLKKQKWFLPAISAAVSVVSGVIIIATPFSTTNILWAFIGISLIVEAVFDAGTLILGITKNTSEEAAAAKPVPAEEEADAH